MKVITTNLLNRFYKNGVKPIKDALAAVFGYTLDLNELGNRLIVVVNAVFTVLVILGVVTDHTTRGVKDSTQALTYTEPK